MHTLKFKSDYIDPILSRAKKTTWRVDHETVFEPEEQITFIDQFGNGFAIAEVDWYKLTEVKFMTDADFKYHGGTETLTYVQDTLQELYPQHDIAQDTEISVIRFRVTEDIRE